MKTIFSFATLSWIAALSSCFPSAVADEWGCFFFWFCPEDDPAGLSTLVLDAEDGPHAATWLQWPHNFGWDSRHVQRYETMWVDMTKALTDSAEKVNIIVYNSNERNRVTSVLRNANVVMNRIEMFTWRTNDVWVRDNGPIFVTDSADGALVVEDWEFNGWGGRAEFRADNRIPSRVGRALMLPVENVEMVLEGGAIEVDGRGTLMAKKSSIINNNRNRWWTQRDVEDYMRDYLGVTNFIWLEGTPNLDITDDHIDGTARFANGNTIVLLNRNDFHDPTEYDVLANARDAQGNPYNLVHIPVTKNNVPGTQQKGLYVNYYVGNDVVLVPAFNDDNDDDAVRVLQSVYPNKRAVLINSIELFKDGGVIHCVTMQQPVA